MSSWKAYCSRWSVTISRVAVIGSPVVGSGGASGAAAGAVWRSHLIPSQIIGIKSPGVNDAARRIVFVWYLPEDPLMRRVVDLSIAYQVIGDGPIRDRPRRLGGFKYVDVQLDVSFVVVLRCFATFGRHRRQTRARPVPSVVADLLGPSSAGMDDLTSCWTTSAPIAWRGRNGALMPMPSWPTRPGEGLAALFCGIPVRQYDADADYPVLRLCRPRSTPASAVPGLGACRSLMPMALDPRPEEPGLRARMFAWTNGPAVSPARSWR